MAIEKRTESHERNNDGRINLNVRPKPQFHPVSRFLAGTTATMAVALGITGLLLNESIKNNQIAREQLAVLRTTIDMTSTQQPQPTTHQQTKANVQEPCVKEEPCEEQPQPKTSQLPQAEEITEEE